MGVGEWPQWGSSLDTCAASGDIPPLRGHESRFHSACLKEQRLSWSILFSGPDSSCSAWLWRNSDLTPHRYFKGCQSAGRWVVRRLGEEAEQAQYWYILQWFWGPRKILLSYKTSYLFTVLVGQLSKLLLGYEPLSSLYCNAEALPYPPFFVVWCSEKDAKCCPWKREDYCARPVGEPGAWPGRPQGRRHRAVTTPESTQDI